MRFAFYVGDNFPVSLSQGYECTYFVDVAGIPQINVFKNNHMAQDTTVPLCLTETPIQRQHQPPHQSVVRTV